MTEQSPSTSAGSLSALHRYFEVSLYLALLTSVLALVSTGKLDLVSTLLPPAAVLAKGLRWLRSSRAPEPELSHRAATWFVTAYFAFFPVDLWFISRTLAENAPNPALYAALLASIHLMLFAMIVRLYSATSTRDHVFLALLAFACMLAAAILTVDTTYLVFFLIFVLLCISTFVSLEMRRSAEGASAPPLAAGTPAARRLHRALGMTSAAVAGSALVIGALLFFVIPRFTAGYLGGLNFQPTLISGFSDNVELGQIGVIKKSDALVMRVRVEGDPVQAENARWRGMGFTTFDGRRWYTEPRITRTILPSAQGWYYLGDWMPWLSREPGSQLRLRLRAPLLAGFHRLRYAVLLEPLATDSLFLATHGVMVRGNFWLGATRAGQQRTGYLEVDATRSLSNPYHNFTRIRYEAESLLPAFPPELLRQSVFEYPKEIRDAYLQLPELDPRIPGLAQQVAEPAATAYDKARAIEQYLRTRYGYTLEQPSPPPADPLAHFLFERRKGHCEYFATAMTVMLRTLGIPARYVNGFLPGEYNDVGKDFIIRARDAHSWVEVYLPEFGWIPFDPTPPADEEARGVLGRLALYWDWFELAWSEWVINYDFRHQATLAQNFQRASRRWSERFRLSVEGAHRKGIERLKTWQARVLATPHVLPIVLAGLLLSALLLRGSAIGRYLATQWGLRFSNSQGLTPQLATAQYHHMLRLLARHGWRKHPGQTAQEFATTIPAPELAKQVANFTELYQAARFGAHPAGAQSFSRLLAVIKALLRTRSR